MATSNSTIHQFQRVQNGFMRVCLNLPSYIQTDLLHEAAGLETIRETCEPGKKTHKCNKRYDNNLRIMQQLSNFDSAEWFQKSIRLFDLILTVVENNFPIREKNIYIYQFHTIYLFRIHSSIYRLGNKGLFLIFFGLWGGVPSILGAFGQRPRRRRWPTVLQ